MSLIQNYSEIANTTAVVVTHSNYNPYSLLPIYYVVEFIFYFIIWFALFQKNKEESRYLPFYQAILIGSLFGFIFGMFTGYIFFSWYGFWVGSSFGIVLGGLSCLFNKWLFDYRNKEVNDTPEDIKKKLEIKINKLQKKLNKL